MIPQGEASLPPGDQLLDEVAARVEHRHGPGPFRGRRSGGRRAGRRVGHVEVAVDVLHVERDQPGRQQGVHEGAGQARQVERAVEDVDSPLLGVGGVEEVARRGTCDVQALVAGSGGRRLRSGPSCPRRCSRRRWCRSGWRR